MVGIGGLDLIPKPGLTEISSSEMRAWQRCRRKWWLRYYRILAAPEGNNSPQNVGNMVHKALEMYYSKATQIDPLASIQEMYQKLLEDYPAYVDTLVRDQGVATMMVSSYIRWLEEEFVDVDLDFYEAESRVSVPLGDTGYTLTGRMDARARRKSTGGRITMDHKTVASLDEIQKTAQIDNQFLTYDLIDFLAHDETQGDGVLINMLRRVDSSHPNSKPPYFARYEIRYNLQELRNHWKHVLSICKEIDEAIQKLVAGGNHQTIVPPSPSKQCAWDCPYRSICPMFDDGSNVDSFIAANYTEGLSYEHQRGPTI